MPIVMYVDGACRNNPGPGGHGVHALIDGQPVDLSGGEPDTTNNRMELTAAIVALESQPDGSVIEIRTDSEYVKKGFTEWLPRWKANGWKTSDRKPVKNQDLWVRLEHAASWHFVTWIWIRGHNGEAGNERADRLANAAICDGG